MAEIIRFRRAHLGRAREIVEHPDLFGSQDIIDACETLWQYGDRDDVDAVLALQRAGIVAGFSPRDGHRRRRLGALGPLGAYLVLASVVGTLVMAHWLLRALRLI